MLKWDESAFLPCRCGMSNGLGSPCWELGCHERFVVPNGVGVPNTEFLGVLRPEEQEEEAATNTEPQGVQAEYFRQLPQLSSKYQQPVVTCY